jgi:hypothetical protein
MSQKNPDLKSCLEPSAAVPKEKSENDVLYHKIVIL